MSTMLWVGILGSVLTWIGGCLAGIMIGRAAWFDRLIKGIG